MISAGTPISPVTAAQPTTGGIAPGRAADDDVQRSRSLQQKRVDEHVEREGRQRQARRQQVHRPVKEQEAAGRQRQSEQRRLLRLDLPRRHRPVSRPQHQLVDVAVEVHVHRVRAAGDDRAAQDSREDQPERRDTLLREHHRRNRRDHEQADDTRLREADVRRGPRR